MQVDTLLKFIVRGGVFLLPIVPFIVTSSLFFPFIGGKNIFFRIVVEISVAAWLLLILRDRTYRPRMSWLVGAFVAFMAVTALANIFGENPHHSFWSNFERMEGYVTLLHLFGYFLVVGSVFKTQKVWTRLWNTTLGASVVLSGFSLLQLAGVFQINQGVTRIDATFGNATYLAVYLLFHIFIALLLLYRWRGALWMRYVYGGIALVEVYLLFQTGTRGTILGLLGGLIVAALCILFFERSQPHIQKIAASGLLAIVVFVGLFFALKDTRVVQESTPLQRLANISLENATTRSRFVVWGMAATGFLENPLLGKGQGNFNLVFNKHFDPILYDQEPWFDRAHNAVFDWLTNGGILGLLTYVGLFVSVLYMLWRHGRDISITERAIITGLLIGYFFHNLFVFDNVVSYILFATVLGYVHARAVQPEEKEYGALGRALPARAHALLSAVIVAVFAGGFYLFNIPTLQASRTLITALQQHPEGIAGNVVAFERALSYQYMGGGQEIREQFLRFAEGVVQSEALDELKQMIVDRAAQTMDEYVMHDPNDARLHLSFGDFLNRLGLFEEAEPYLERAQELSPRKQLIYFAQAGNALGRGDTTRAVELTETALALEPENKNAQINYASMLVRNGQSTRAAELLEEWFGASIPAEPQLIAAYSSIGNVKMVEQLWRSEIAQNPSEPQTYASFAASYVELGLRDRAISILEEAGRAIPDFAVQANVFIDAIRSGEI